MSMTNPLTPDEVNDLQGRELDAAVAEWMGWLPTPSSHKAFDNTDGWSGFLRPDSSGLYEFVHDDAIPKYSIDTESMPIYEVENEIQKRGLVEPYIEALSQIISSQSRTTVDFLWRMAHATPEQRARAVVLMAQETAAQNRLMHQMSDHAMGAVGGE